ncbi:hypothetical protein HNY73_013221 [Argiope bruennichi]|uniref:Uncharacterized protein n=1 Tax=Argiope bruennichi TaxID=94029 RepID=A0A8T0EY47_ARGBR|nr:hypothetical protein HNY73_013221 [Argiope bruennichi]
MHQRQPGKRASLGDPASNPEDESSRPWTGSKLIPRPAARLKSNSCYYRFGKLLLRGHGQIERKRLILFDGDWKPRAVEFGASKKTLQR